MYDEIKVAQSHLQKARAVISMVLEDVVRLNAASECARTLRGLELTLKGADFSMESAINAVMEYNGWPAKRHKPASDVQPGGKSA